MNEAKRQIMSILGEAVEQRSPEGRAAFLDQACAGDAELRARVEALLRAYEAAGNFLQGSPPAPEAGTVDVPFREGPGTVIGPYKLLEQIGEGGFGVVYMAEQTEPVRRKVALKILKPGMDTRQVVARFEAERQALAIMDHPNIAKVFDGGSTGQSEPRPSGSGRAEPLPYGRSSERPYFVMELVKGVPITEFCDQNHMTPRQRLELFIPVCQAVQHAHQKGIIHRDLKPSNVLVTVHDTTPVPKVIDFGVAKALGQELTDKTLFTGFAQMIGTPLYMSPEQAGQSGLDIDTRSDIYSLGVLLYELLTGTTPFEKERFKQAAYDEIRRIIRDEEPPKPSTRLSDTWRAEHTARSAERKAQSAECGAKSAGRGGLNGKGASHFALRALRFYELDWIVMKALEKDRNRRYETANAFAMDVQRYLADEPVLACPPSLGYRLQKSIRRNKVALAVSGLVLFFLVVLGSGIGWVVRDRAAREDEQIREQAERDQELAREKATRQARVAGQVELILQDVEGLEREQKWPEALVAARRAEAVLAGGESDPATQNKVSAAINDLELAHELEEVRLRISDMIQGGSYVFEDISRHYAAVFEKFGVDVKALPVDEAAAQLQARPAVIVAVAQALDDWGLWEDQAGNQQLQGMLWSLARAIDPDAWRAQLRQAIVADDVAVLVKLAKSKDTAAQPPHSQLLLARYLVRSELEVAVTLLEEACATDPGDFWIHFDLGFINTTVMKPRRHETAVRHLYAARALRPNNVNVWNNLGVALSSLGKLDEAIACYHRALILDPKHAGVHDRLGSILRKQGKLPEAIAKFREAIELNPNYALAHSNLRDTLMQMKLNQAVDWNRKAIELDPKDAIAHAKLGSALASQKKLDEAIAYLRRAVELDPKYAPAHDSLGSVLDDQNKLDDAIASYRKAIEVDPKYAAAHYNLGIALGKQGKMDEAIDCFRKAIELNPKDDEALCNLGFALSTRGKLDEAIENLRQAIKLGPKNIMAHLNLGAAFQRQKKLDEAVAALRTALELFPKDARIHSNLGVVLRAQGKLLEAIASHRKAVELDSNNAQVRTNWRHALRQMFNEGVAQYRAGEWAAAVKTLDQVRHLSRVITSRKTTPVEAVKTPPQVPNLTGGGGDAAVFFFLAMAHQQLDKREDARQCYDRAVEWMEKHMPMNEELRRFRAEAETVLGIKK